ncbi:MAG: hypothetical protein ACI9R3_006184 [Verrucomicrobiales bacterium]|jgi:hypothetical protein
MIPKSLNIVVLVAFCIPLCTPSCSTFEEKAAVVPADSAVITVQFRNDSSAEVRWTVEDENTNKTVFRDQLFAPGEVKGASIATSSSRRYGAVQFRHNESSGWQQDSLITTGQTVEMNPVLAQ